MLFENYISNPYLRISLTLILIFAALKISVIVIDRIISRITKKTKTDIDDIMVKKASKPIIMILFLIGIKLTLNELTLSEHIEGIISKVIYSFIIIFSGYVIYAGVDLIFIRAWNKFALKTKSGLDDAIASLAHGLIKTFLIILAGLYILTLWNVQIGPFLAGLGIAGLAVALALQPTLSNIFSGISVILDKTIRIGDLIYLDEKTKGKIIKIGFRSTRIRNFDNELIIIPNSQLADSKIQNVALPEPKSRAVIPFSVAYGSKIEKVKKIVLKEIKKINHVEDNPEPMVRFIEMANSSLNFKAYFYVDSFENRFEAIDEANTRIYNILNKNKISIPFPQIDVHLKK